jgi:hypothetical protein
MASQSECNLEGSDRGLPRSACFVALFWFVWGWAGCL